MKGQTSKCYTSQMTLTHPIRQRAIVQLRSTRKFRRAVVISGDAFNRSSGQVLVAPIVPRHDHVSFVELPIDGGTVVTLFGLRPVRVEHITEIIGCITPEQLTALHDGLEFAGTE